MDYVRNILLKMVRIYVMSPHQYISISYAKVLIIILTFINDLQYIILLAADLYKLFKMVPVYVISISSVKVLIIILTLHSYTIYNILYY